MAQGCDRHINKQNAGLCLSRLDQTRCSSYNNRKFVRKRLGACVPRVAAPVQMYIPDEQPAIERVTRRRLNFKGTAPSTRSGTVIVEVAGRYL